jgi:ABC-type transport system involved in multi-copper enzyme maturation permease subunit
MLLRMMGLTIFIGGVFFIAGKRTSADQMALVLGSGLGAALIVPLGIARDKMEGTLELLCGLPVSPRVIAVSRIAAGALLSLPWAFGAGLFAFRLLPGFPLNPFGVSLLAWLVLVLLSACGTAVLARFELESVLGVPFVAALIVLVLLPRALRALYPGLSADLVLEFLGRPAAPALLALALLSTFVACGAIALEITSRAFATYARDTTRR